MAKALGAPSGFAGMTARSSRTTRDVRRSAFLAASRPEPSLYEPTPFISLSATTPGSPRLSLSRRRDVRSVFDVRATCGGRGGSQTNAPLELMGRASTGLARTCALLLQRTRGRSMARALFCWSAWEQWRRRPVRGSRVRNRGAVVTAIACAEEVHPEAALHSEQWRSDRRRGQFVLRGDCRECRSHGRRVVGDRGHGSLRGISPRSPTWPPTARPSWSPPTCPVASTQTPARLLVRNLG